MNKQNYEDMLCEAIDIIAKKRISESNFVSTIKCQIIKCTDARKGQYVVKYQDTYMEAFSINNKIQFSENSQVYVLVPNNDFDERKIILYSVSAGVGFSSLSAYVDDEGYLVLESI